MRGPNSLGCSIKALLRLFDNVAAWCTNMRRASINRFSWAFEHVSDSTEKSLPMALVGLTFDMTPICVVVITGSSSLC